MFCGLVFVWLPNLHHPPPTKNTKGTHSRGKQTRTRKSKPHNASNAQSEYKWADVFGEISIWTCVFRVVSYCSARRGVFFNGCVNGRIRRDNAHRLWNDDGIDSRWFDAVDVDVTWPPTIFKKQIAIRPRLLSTLYSNCEIPTVHQNYNPLNDKDGLRHVQSVAHVSVANERNRRTPSQYVLCVERNYVGVFAVLLRLCARDTETQRHPNAADNMNTIPVYERSKVPNIISHRV